MNTKDFTEPSSSLASTSNQSNSKKAKKRSSSSISQEQSPKKRQTGVKKIQDRLTSIENTLTDIVPRLSYIAEEYSKSLSTDNSLNTDVFSCSPLYLEPTPLKDLFYESDYSFHLVALFYTIHEYTGQAPVISRRSFFDSLTSSPQPPFLVHAMFAFAACYSNHSLIYPKNDSFSRFFSESSLKMILCTMEPSVSSVQALILLSSFKIQKGNPTQAWITIGHAIRFSQMIGLDKINSQGVLLPCLSGYHTPELNTLWKLCCFADTEISSILNKPPLTKVQGENLLQSPTLIPEAAKDSYILSCLSVLPEHVVFFLENFRNLLNLWSQVQNCSKTLEALKFSPYDQISFCLALDDQLKLWYQRLPSKLNYHSEYFHPFLIQKFPFLEQIINLHILFYRIRIALFLPFVENFSAYLNYQDFTVIIREFLLAAHNLTRLLEDWSDCFDNFKNTAHLNATLEKFNIFDSDDSCFFSPEGNKATPFFLSSHFFYAGLAFILFTNLCNSTQFSKQFSEIGPRQKNRAIKQLDSLLELLKAFPLWESSEKIAEKLSELYASI